MVNLTLNISTESFPFTSCIQHGNPPYLVRVVGKLLLDGDDFSWKILWTEILRLLLTNVPFPRSWLIMPCGFSQGGD